MQDWLKRILIGRPLLTQELSHQRLANWAALPIFASDALSSVAYANDEILLALAKTGPASLYVVPFLAIAIVLLLGIVSSSYKQTIRAYPGGGGAYTVAKENLGTGASLVAGAALLVDYVLTVAVSISAGTAAITAAVPALYDHRVNLALMLILIITVANLRGVRESGALFSPPVYAFIACMGLLIVTGILRAVTRTLEAVPPPGTGEPFEPLTSLVVLTAFSSGCVALTGIEAISNGVMAFKPPESENAGRVLTRLVLILSALLLGVSFLSWKHGGFPGERETLLSVLGKGIFGEGIVYVLIQGTTATILVLAANTSFADFPRLSSVMARDSFLPRQLQNLGDRLCYSNGILLLAASSAALVLLFSAKTHFLIPLYAVGVFLSFTLSQTGMVVHSVRARGSAWARKAALNAIGALTTAVVLLVILRSKFIHGAWIVCVVIPLLVLWSYSIRRHYRSFDRFLALPVRLAQPRMLNHTIVVPVSRIHRGVVQALEYAQSLTKRIRAVHVSFDEESGRKLAEEWRAFAPHVPLTLLPSPYRSLAEPLLKFVRAVEAEVKEDIVTVVIPNFVPSRPWHNLLHNQTAVALSRDLSDLKNVVVTVVRVPVE